MSTLIRVIGEHRMAILTVSEGRHAGRYVVAYDFFGKWRYLADEDSGEIRSYKTAYEALHIGEAYRQTLDEMLTAVLQSQPRASARGARG